MGMVSYEAELLYTLQIPTIRTVNKPVVLVQYSHRDVDLRCFLVYVQSYVTSLPSPKHAES